ncbi:MAG TPA: tetratricopeptide repeat protein [Thermoanaerobaculia bacterium]|jgi:tetratricopeptide (TPR) repeat protein|nr:tetratricopeptide repeat protein [Thermoanaerobaculia bacterium]
MSKAIRSLSLSAALLALGCSQYKPFDSVDYLREQYAREIGSQAAAGVEVPFEIDAELRAELAKLPRLQSELRRVNQVNDFIFDGLQLQYSLEPTRNAVATFQNRAGNCLSFVNLFVGVARELGLNPYYVEVTDLQKWNHRDGMVVSQGHIVAGMYIDGVLRTFDFLPYRQKAYRSFKPIDDLTAAAHYYNNLGAEALLGGDLERARGLLTTATRIAPRFDKAVNNLGVVQARSGHPAQALETYKRGLEISPEDSTLLTNMARALQQLGRAEEARGLLARIEDVNTTNPFFFIYQAEVALGGGDNAKALDYMTRALRLDSELPEVHLGFVKVYLALGDLEKARHHLGRALKLDATNQDALQYARMLGQ